MEARSAAETATRAAVQEKVALEAVVRDAQSVAETSTHEKMALEAKVKDLEEDVLHARLDLKTVSKQFNAACGKLQVAEEVDQKRVEEITGELSFPVFTPLLLLVVSPSSFARALF